MNRIRNNQLILVCLSASQLEDSDPSSSSLSGHCPGHSLSPVGHIVYLVIVHAYVPCPTFSTFHIKLSEPYISAPSYKSQHYPGK